MDSRIFGHLSRLRKLDRRDSSSCRTCSNANVTSTHLTFEYSNNILKYKDIVDIITFASMKMELAQ